jgi:hypothetical protein
MTRIRDWAAHYSRLNRRQERAAAEGQSRPDPVAHLRPAPAADDVDTEQHDDQEADQ